MKNLFPGIDWEEVRNLSAVAFIIGAFLFVGIDFIFSKPHPHTGTITDKKFVPERRWVTVTVHSSKRGTYTSVQHHYTPPEWDLTVYGDDAKTVVIPVETGYWQAVPLSTIIHYKTFHGYFTGWRYCSRRVQTDW